MFTRVITIATNPATQCALYFTSKENAEIDAGLSECGNLIFKDDFGQSLVITAETKKLITTDMITDQIQQFSIQAQKKLDELAAAEDFQEYLNSNPELKSRLEAKARSQTPPPPSVQRNGFRPGRG